MCDLRHRLDDIDEMMHPEHYVDPPHGYVEPNNDDVHPADDNESSSSDDTVGELSD